MIKLEYMDCCEFCPDFIVGSMTKTGDVTCFNKKKCERLSKYLERRRAWEEQREENKNEPIV